jgi:ubiquinone/menaquinone biosynthesis C-methylase UbiE
MRLNIGAGNRRLEGYVGIDAVARPAADIVAFAHEIPLEDGCADEIMAIHLWEHFYRFECDAVIKEWRRLLKRGGRLVLELPDLAKACRNLLDARQGPKHEDQMHMWALYGDPRKSDPFMAHRWGWTPQSIAGFLSSNGFIDIVEQPTQWHPVGRGLRDMRIEARKA